MEHACGVTSCWQERKTVGRCRIAHSTDAKPTTDAETKVAAPTDDTPGLPVYETVCFYVASSSEKSVK